MPSTAPEKETCAKCGAEIRDNTQFCYNCGAGVAAEAEEPIAKPAELDPKAKAALDDLARKLDSDEADKDGKLAKAADERKKARVAKRQPRTYRWEPVASSAVSYVLIVAVAIAVLAAIVVAMTVFFK